MYNKHSSIYHFCNKNLLASFSETVSFRRTKLTKCFVIGNYRPQRSWGKVIFSQASVILSMGGEYLGRYTPQDQVHPPGTRYTPWDQTPPPGDQDTPPQDQVHPPGPCTSPRTRCPPRTRYTPSPGTRYTPLGPGTPQSPGTRYTARPWDQVHPPPGPGTPPSGSSACREIRATSGQYASYWNAF